MYSGYGLTFHCAGSQSFDNTTATNVLIFGIDNSSLCHSDNRKNNFLVLSESPTFAINGSFGSPEKMFSINFSKANKTFCLSLYYAADSSYLFVNDKEIFKFKVDNENVSFPAQFCLGSISNEFIEVPLNGNVYDFSVGLNLIGKSEILITHKYLMTKNNIKQYSALLNKCLLYYWILVAP